MMLNSTSKATGERGYFFSVSGYARKRKNILKLSGVAFKATKILYHAQIFTNLGELCQPVIQIIA